MKALFACALLGAGLVLAGCMGGNESPTPFETTPPLVTLRIK